MAVTGVQEGTASGSVVNADLAGPFTVGKFITRCGSVRIHRVTWNRVGQWCAVVAQETGRKVSQFGLVVRVAQTEPQRPLIIHVVAAIKVACPTGTVLVEIILDLTTGWHKRRQAGSEAVKQFFKGGA